MTVIRNIFFYQEQTCRITCSEFAEEKPILMLNAMNGRRSGGGFNVTPDALLDDGLFTVLVIPRISIVQRLRYLPVIEKGKHTDLPFLRYFKTNRIRIACAESMDAHLDGEYLSSREFDIEVVKGKFLFRY
jgi:diacylglycerol kinase (ATP)